MAQQRDDSPSGRIHADRSEDEFDPILQYASTNDTFDDDNDDDGGEKEKAFANQESQVNLMDVKPKKRIGSPRRHKKTKSAPNQSTAPSTTNRMTLRSEFTSTTITRLPSATPKTEESIPTGKNVITVDTSKARSNLDVVRMCIRELGWRECFFSTIIDPDIHWHSTSFHEGNSNSTIHSGRVNKFPRMNELLRKVHLTRALNHMRLLFPEEFDFYPRTWFLPEQSQQFKDDVRYIHQQDKQEQRALTTFIVKPSDGSQGEGIYLLRDPAHYTVTNRPHVAQEYIDRPLLMNGLKFDLRIYVLILNLYPLEIFLYDEGLVRFATIDYKAPSSDNLHQTYMHLTNYSLNKRSSAYKHTVDSQQTDGSKRKLSTVWMQLAHSYGAAKVEETKLLIVEMINKTILAVLPHLRVEYEFEIPLNRKQNVSCFQIVGFDIILTDELKPILLEVNANPSLRIDYDKANETGKMVYQSSPIDEEIKRPLILETLKLALPKKRLTTLTRHAQLQINDELLAQRLAKVARRRVEERNEKLKSAQKTRFDIKRNPYFSRPVERKSRESEDAPLKTKKPAEPEENNEHEVSAAAANDRIDALRVPSATQRRPAIKPTTNRRRSPSKVTSVKKLQLIYPSEDKTKYQHLVLIDKIAYIYIHFVVLQGDKSVSTTHFRSFASTCGVIDETIKGSSIDILYYQILRKWQQFVLNAPLSGLPFSAFVEAVFLLSQRKYPSAPSLLDSVSQLVHVCIRNLKSSFQTASNQQRPPRISSARNRSAAPSIPVVPAENNGKNKPLTKSVFPLFFDAI